MGGIMKLKLFAACGVAAGCLSTMSIAQTQETQPTVAMPVATQQIPPTIGAAQRILPAGTIIVVTPLEEISSKHIAVGDHYQFQVVNDVTDNGVTVIPRGSIATGTITFKTGRAIGGKSGKFEVAFESVTASGHQFPLGGVYRQEGKGNTVGALLGSIWISGHSAVMLPGQMVNALIKEPTPY